MSAEGKESEGDRGVKGKYLFTFSQRPGVCEMQFALKKKKTLRLAILTPKGELVRALGPGYGSVALVTWFLPLTKAKRDWKG